MSEWKKFLIGDIGEVIGGGTPKTSNAENFGGAIPWITPKDLSERRGRYIGSGSRNLSESGLKLSSAKMLPEGAVLLSSRAPIGYTAIAKNPVSTNQGFRSVVTNELCYNKYLYYWFTNNRSALESRATGSTFKELSGSSLKEIEIELPPLSEQRQIASILGALDDKIENNRKTAATLEEIARALYRSWFVDFDPVHAKAAGEKPAFMDEETAALFPDRFGDDGLPEGWEVRSIGSVGEIVGGGTPSKKEPAFWQNGHHLWATPRDLAQQKSPVIFETENCVTDAGLSKISSRLSPPGTVLLSSRAPIGYLAIAAEPISFNQGFIGIRETEAISGPEAYFWCLENMEIILANSNGSTFQEISKKAFKPIRYLLAPYPVRQSFYDYAGIIFRKITILNRENRSLATLRDTLLPKLISGEIRVGEAREQVEEVT